MKDAKDPTSLASLLHAEQLAALRSARTSQSAVQACVRSLNVDDVDVTNTIEIAKAISRNANELLERLAAMQAFAHARYLEEESRS